MSDLLDHVTYDTIGLSWSVILGKLAIAIDFESAVHLIVGVQSVRERRKLTGNPEYPFLDIGLPRRHSRPWQALCSFP